MARNTPLGQRDWIIFGIIGWNFRIQRPQHLARELARAGDTVFYIEPDFVADERAGFSIRQIDPSDVGRHNAVQPVSLRPKT